MATTLFLVKKHQLSKKNVLVINSSIIANISIMAMFFLWNGISCLYQKHNPIIYYLKSVPITALPTLFHKSIAQETEIFHFYLGRKIQKNVIEHYMYT